MNHSLPTLTLMWWAMMTAMMAPTAWPWITTVHRLVPTGGEWRVPSAVEFAAGYLVAWLAYAFGAATAMVLLEHVSTLPRGAALAPWVESAVLVSAGLFQFSRWKVACLTHCRNPLSYFLTRWNNGPAAAFRMGLHHGWYCIGCCWALMLTSLAMGVMNLAWMVALALIAFVEQVVPGGHRLRAPIGVALVAMGLWRFYQTV